MARSRGPARRSAPMQSRSASTMAAPARSAPAPAPTASAPVAAAPAAQQPGLFAQMASTAAGVAVGSAVGHTIGAGITGLFSGGSSAEAPVAAPSQQVTPMAPATSNFSQEGARHCDVDARNFTRCLEDNNGNFQICDYYLQQLKACQEAARQY